MLERNIYFDGDLVISRVSGAVKSQDLIDHVFWLIDSHNIGEVKTGFSQLIYVEDIESMDLTEEDVHRISQISTGMGQARGKFKTAIIAVEPYDMKLAHLHKSLARISDLEVEVCDDFKEAFLWLGCDNPDPDMYK